MSEKMLLTALVSLFVVTGCGEQTEIDPYSQIEQAPTRNVLDGADPEAIRRFTANAQSERNRLGPHKKKGLGQTVGVNALTPEEKQAGFELLFNGQDLEGWDTNWKVEDGAIAWQELGRGGARYAAKKIPDDFELKFEWKVAEGSNSGVTCRPGLYEYQILDNDNNGDGLNPRTSAASLYFCMPPSHDATKPIGHWNSGRLVYKGTVIQHWLNGEKVVDFDYSDPKWAENVELLRKRAGTNLKDRGANLVFQNHGNPVWFRSVKLRELDEDVQLDQTPVTPATLSLEAKEKEQQTLKWFMEQRQKKQ